MRETFSIRPTRHYMPVEDVIIGDESKFLIVAFLCVKHLAFALLGITCQLRTSLLEMKVSFSLLRSYA